MAANPKIVAEKAAMKAASDVIAACKELLPEKVTIWPRLPGPGSSYDTEGGAQPYEADFVGFAKNGNLLVRVGDWPVKEIGPEFLTPDRGA